MKEKKVPGRGPYDSCYGKRLLPYTVLSLFVHLSVATLVLSATLLKPNACPLPFALKVRLASFPAEPNVLPEAPQPEESLAQEKSDYPERVGPPESKSQKTVNLQQGPSSGQAPAQGAARVSTPLLLGTSGFEFAYYYKALELKLCEAWLYPSLAVSGESLVRAMVALVIDSDGAVKMIRLQESSGSEVFDRSVLRAVEASAPFPPLPDGYAGRSLGTIFVTFEYRYQG